MPSKKPSLRKMPRCCRRKFEGSGHIFRYFFRNFVFDVDRALEIVRDGREPVELTEESLRVIWERTRIDRRHLKHVDPSRPGIIAHVQATTVEGETVEGQVLIDGNHRAVRCSQLHRPFLAYLLTPEESASILLRTPRDRFVVRAEAKSRHRARH